MADSSKSKRTTYENVKQGTRQIYPKEDDVELNKKTTIDVVFVPGLGARPDESWQSTKSGWNWASDKAGLAKDYPSARVLLYSYESAFHGSLKVEQFMDNIALTLLESLQVFRDKQTNRPLVFIGHSMGGLVIAKAVALMDSRRDKYPMMLEATAGCIFFGSPFLGAQSASMAAMFSIVGEKFGQATTSKLLDLMKPGDELLRELRGDFLRLATKTSPKIEIHCFWEEQNTDVAKMGVDFMKKHVGDRIASSFYDVFKLAKEPFKIVDRESASFDNAVENSGLACNHRDLVKFEDSKEGRFQVMRGPLKRILHGAPLIAKNRINSARNIDLEGMKNITKALGGSVSVQARRKVLEPKFTPSSWLPTEPEFTDWLAGDDDPHEETAADRPRGDCLWICGAEGRGKTGASLAALQQIESTIKKDKHMELGEPPVLLVYYFCDPVDFSTAEELLKSLVWQLTQEQPLFASYAKQFTEREGRRPVALSIENLWQSLQDMFSDATASSRIYIVINNLHSLSDDSDSTRKLLELIKGDIEVMNDHEINRTSVRWLFTSRKAKTNIDTNLRIEGVRQIDLEHEKYTGRVQLELRRHAQDKVAILGSEKGYKKDLAYFVGSLIGNRAQNKGWIDITVDQLEELDRVESALRVRQKLKTLPQKLDDLLDGAWQQIFDANPERVDVIREMLRALVLTYEDPSLEELAILGGFTPDEAGLAELRSLIEICSSFLVVRQANDREEAVCFKNDIAKPHLLRHAHQLLGLSPEETQWQQGELALRSFVHLLERYTLPEPVEGANTAEAGEQNEANETKEEGKENEENENDAGDEEESGDEDDESEEDSDSESDDEETLNEVKLEAVALPYMVKHWLHHASKATPDMAEDLSKEVEFWKLDSPVRRRWLAQYGTLSNIFECFETHTWTALHVASSIGYRHLVSALMKNGHQDEISKYESYSNAPIHFSAYYARPNITEELIYRGASVDDVENPGDETPLAMAASKGNVKVMKLLLDAGANINSIDNDTGAVINGAIQSGNLNAVGLLVEKGSTLSYETHSPLSYAAMLPDHTIFDYIMDAGKEELQAHDYNAALIAAAYAGNKDVFAQLLGYTQDENTLVDALRQATDEAEWEVVKHLLDQHKGLPCDHLFTELATSAEDLDDLLLTVWEYADGSISQEALNAALYQATDNEKESTVRKLLELGADANATGDDYGNALTAAAYDGTLNMVNMLLEHDAKVESESGWALQTAAGEGHIDVVARLLEAGADVNRCTKDERFPQGTALQAAVESGKQDIVTFLLEKGADPNLGGGELVCPIIAAACKAEGPMMEQLVKAGAHVNVAGDSYASTPMVNTAMFLPVPYLKVLLEAGADVNLADVDGDTPLIIAASEGDKESVEFLLEHGADVKAVSHVREVNALQAAFARQQYDCVEVLINHVSGILSGGEIGKKVGGGDGRESDAGDSEATGEVEEEHDEEEQSGEEHSGEEEEEDEE